MATRQVRQQKALKTMAATKQRSQQCPQDTSCNCNPKRFPNRLAQPLLHMDECDDPECIDFEQLKELQRSIDRFTDYDHYEKCCDGNHAEGEECNGNPTKCCQESSTLSEDCDECFDDCDECVEEHEMGHINDFDRMLDAGTPVKCDDDCVQCEEDCEENGHERKDCPQDHHTSWDSCISTCGVCVDPTPLPLLGPEAEMQLYDLNAYIPHITPCDERCTPPPDSDEPSSTFSVPNTSKSVFDVNLDHWQTFQQGHHCAPDPCLVDQGMNPFQPPQHVDPGFGFTFGCDPTVPGNQYHWQHNDSLQPICGVQAFGSLDLNGLAHNMNEFTPVNFSVPEQSTNPGQVLNDINTLSVPKPSSPKAAPPPPKTGKSCQWLMPCGSICGQTFARTDDLKKHVKNSHLSLKGTVTCRWGSACSSTFASEAALTGHISKKHLAPLYATGSTSTANANNSPSTDSTSAQADGLPWKCTFPGCSKSFMYKQVRDEHVASHTGSNRAHCPICHQWLNAEGSNFRRHMASHRPENEHMRCKHHHKGCARAFYRMDNLRRHQQTCKYGKHDHSEQIHRHSVKN